MAAGPELRFWDPRRRTGVRHGGMGNAGFLLIIHGSERDLAGFSANFTYVVTTLLLASAYMA